MHIRNILLRTPTLEGNISACLNILIKRALAAQLALAFWLPLQALPGQSQLHYSLSHLAELIVPQPKGQDRRWQSHPIAGLVDSQHPWAHGRQTANPRDSILCKPWNNNEKKKKINNCLAVGISPTPRADTYSFGLHLKLNVESKTISGLPTRWESNLPCVSCPFLFPHAPELDHFRVHGSYALERGEAFGCSRAIPSASARTGSAGSPAVLTGGFCMWP